MSDNPQKTFLEVEDIRKELALTWQEYLVNSTDTYKKQGTKRARANLVKIGKLAKKYRVLTTILSKVSATDLLELNKELRQQKTTL